MEPALAAKHPDIKTYAGNGIDDPTASVRLDLTPLGFNASVRGANGVWYVDPYYHLDQSVYISYFGNALTSSPHGTFVERDGDTGLAATRSVLPKDVPTGARTVGSSLRIYRLALASDPSYYSYFGSVPANVTAGKVTLINRVTQIYEDETSIRLILVGTNDAVNFNTASQYSAAGYNATSCTSTMLTQNHTAVTNAIGTASFDIGHIILGADGGGLANLGVVGSSSAKGGGCTGVPTPVGDQFAVDYVAHEMGHQFGGGHSFNGITTNCSGGNRDAATSIEPGSGSSIMGYAGICGADDTQPHSDPYWSAISFDEIAAYVSGSTNAPGNGGTVSSTGNTAPVVTTSAGPFTIPTRTPFSLTGSATDANGDTVTYMWEQIDPGTASGTALQTTNKTNGPLFRQFGTALNSGSYGSGTTYNAAGENHPTTNPTRVFPDLTQILANNTDANTGACPGGALSLVDCYSEWLPTSVYPGPMHFRLTARDGRAGGGGVSSSDTQVNVATAAGPFLVTAPNTAVTYSGGNPRTITWNVASTNVAPVNTANVDILLSTDGGQTFPTTLASGTPNDGSQSVTIPNVGTSQARIEIRAAGNIYFDVSDTNFTITQTPLAVTGVSPNSGPTTGGTNITITGSGFAPGDLIEIAQGHGAGPTAILATNVNVVSPTQITATTGGNAIPGYFHLFVVDSVGSTSTATNADLFTYISHPAVTGVSPNSGPTTGGTNITITGSGFAPGDLIEIAQGHGAGPTAILATNVNVVSPTQITATTGGNAIPGYFHLFVVDSVGSTSTATNADLFTYISHPAVTGVSPNSGPTTGGTNITITGSGFAPGDLIEIAQGHGAGPTAILATNVNVVSPTQITATTGGNAIPGYFHLFVVDSVGSTSTATNADLFTYISHPAVTGVSPNSGPTTGGTNITITGSGFAPGDLIEIAQGHGAGPTAILATNVNVVSPTQITATTGGNAIPGYFHLFVVDSVGSTSTATNADLFTYAS